MATESDSSSQDLHVASGSYHGDTYPDPLPPPPPSCHLGKEERGDGSPRANTPKRAVLNRVTPAEATTAQVGLVKQPLWAGGEEGGASEEDEIAIFLNNDNIKKHIFFCTGVSHMNLPPWHMRNEWRQHLRLFLLLPGSHLSH